MLLYTEFWAFSQACLLEVCGTLFLVAKGNCIYIYVCVCVCVCVRYSIVFLSSPTGCHSSPSQIFKLLKLAYSMCRVFFAGMSRARAIILSCLICAMALCYMIKNICLICKWFPLHVKICLHACKNQLAMSPKYILCCCIRYFGCFLKHVC